MNYSLHHIADILGASHANIEDVVIDQLLLDSRKVYSPSQILFIAIKGPHRDGHQFIGELYKKGVRSFLVNGDYDVTPWTAANFVVVNDTLAALQQLATYHRNIFDIPVIGITGSNGKTITKEWLYQILNEDFDIVRSPKSYNSQIGVPLSVWQMKSQHTLGIFEAGISQPGEMEKLEKMIRPAIGVLTNIGEAHNEGFIDMAEKLGEKLKLFSQCQLIIARDRDVAHKKEFIRAFGNKPELITWGHAPGNDLVIKHLEKDSNKTSIIVCSGSAEQQLIIPFTDDASIENAITCYLICLQLGLHPETISRRMLSLQPVNMRLELKKGINHCMIINDSYSADINSLEIALDFQAQQAGELKKTVILSDLLQSARNDEHLYGFILERLRKHRVDRIIAIGERISTAWRYPGDAGPAIELYSSTGEYLRQFRSTQFREEIILVKGARIFEFERIIPLLEQKVHETVLEINLNAIVYNVKAYQKQLKPSTKVMAMVKAFAYGSGGAEIAGILQYHKIDYLGVAYADEGIELRKAGITLPIMVMNPAETAFDSIVEYNLEPDLFSFHMLRLFENFLRREGLQHYPVHVEIETGMNRLGFAAADIGSLADHLSATPYLEVQSVFSHLSASEDPTQDEFTNEQYKRFKASAAILEKRLGYSFLEHIANSAAIFRLPQLHLDMVRLGIGMYGIDSSKQHQALLQPVATLKSTIAQIKYIKAGESVGYNRRSIAAHDAVIATVGIGYADGYSRKLGNGKGKMWVQPATNNHNGQLVPVIGSVCMDMTMLDVTGIDGISEGDEVIVFGKELPLQQLAEWAETIPYELMTTISQRVKRVYFEE